jgi:hypothetical protein
MRLIHTLPNDTRKMGSEHGASRAAKENAQLNTTSVFTIFTLIVKIQFHARMSIYTIIKFGLLMFTAPSTAASGPRHVKCSTD